MRIKKTGNYHIVSTSSEFDHNRYRYINTLTIRPDGHSLSIYDTSTGQRVFHIMIVNKDDIDEPRISHVEDNYIIYEVPINRLLIKTKFLVMKKRDIKFRCAELNNELVAHVL